MFFKSNFVHYLAISRLTNWTFCQTLRSLESGISPLFYESLASSQQVAGKEQC